MPRYLGLVGRIVSIGGALCLAATTLAAQQPPATRAPQAPPRSPYQEAGQLPARIMAFTAEPLAIKPGESVTLKWAVENPRSTTIEPTVGRAIPSGELRLTPAATTTYTLTVTGVNGTLTRSVTVTVEGTQPVAAAADAAPLATRPAPKTADGKPDLTGVYRVRRRAGARRTAASCPSWRAPAGHRHSSRAPKNIASNAGRPIPASTRAARRPECLRRSSSPTTCSSSSRRSTSCILHEYLHLYRVIPLDGSPHPPDPDPFWMGHSTGKWEGDTLVVDSVGFKESEINGYRTTESLHVVERFRRATLGTLEYEAVIEDPNVFAGPWLITRTFPFLPEHNRVDEFFCENNRDYKPLFGASRPVPSSTVPRSHRSHGTLNTN